MDNLFNIPTLMLCLGVGTAIKGCFFGTAWLGNRRDAALLHWSLAYCLLSVGSILLAFVYFLPEWMTVGLGNVLIFCCLVFYRSGFQIFDGKPVSVTIVAIAPVAWIALYAFWPLFSQDMNLRIVVAALFLTVQSLAVSQASLTGLNGQWRSIRGLVAIVFGGVALADTARAIYALSISWGFIYPAQNTPWHGLFMLLSFGLVMFSGFAIFSLVRERIETRYRIASEVDELTGILNRRAFIHYTSEARERGANGGAIALLDIDHFKRINDTYGHGVGDEALRWFTRTISGRLLPGMIFGRVGGEEFALYMPDYDLERAKRHCEVLRAAVEEITIPLPSEELKITVSQGLCADTSSETEVGFLLGLADRALYISKRGGRNRVTALNPSSGLKMIASQMAARSEPHERRSQRAVRSPL